jgi:hypothetical protein
LIFPAEQLGPRVGGQVDLEDLVVEASGHLESILLIPFGQLL